MSYQNQPGEIYNYGGDRYASGNYSNVNPSGNYGNVNVPATHGSQAYGNAGYQGVKGIKTALCRTTLCRQPRNLQSRGLQLQSEFNKL